MHNHQLIAPTRSISSCDETMHIQRRIRRGIVIKKRHRRPPSHRRTSKHLISLTTRNSIAFPPGNTTRINQITRKRPNHRHMRIRITRISQNLPSLTPRQIRQRHQINTRKKILNRNQPRKLNNHNTLPLLLPIRQIEIRIPLNTSNPHTTGVEIRLQPLHKLRRIKLLHPQIRIRRRRTSPKHRSLRRILIQIESTKTPILPKLADKRCLSNPRPTLTQRLTNHSSSLLINHQRPQRPSQTILRQWSAVDVFSSFKHLKALAIELVEILGLSHVQHMKRPIIFKQSTMRRARNLETNHQ